MKKRQAVCGAAFFLANVATGPAQTDPGLSIKPAGVTLSGERLAPEKAPVDLSRPEMRQTERLSTRLKTEYAEAAARGESWAQTKLGKIYVVSNDDELEQQRGIELLRQAAEQNDAEALYQLGALSVEGRGVPESTVQGFQYCKRAAELGYPPAFYQLAALYATGRGTATDEEQAIYWGRKAIEQGNTKAMYSIGRTLLLRGKPEETNEAVALLDQASAEGVVEAAVLLAEAYAKGSNGLNKDQGKARLLLQRHAESNAEARSALADLIVSE